MNFHESEDLKLIRQSVRDFVEREVLPHRMEWDESQHFPKDLFRRMGDIGLMGMLVPEAYGGAGLGYFEYKAAIEEIARG